MNFPSVSPEVQELVVSLSKEYGLLVPSELGIQMVGRIYESRDTGATKAEKLAAKLETLGPGLWLHIDHAATDDPEMRAFGHVGYEWVAADRSAVLEAWTSAKVRDVITRRGIKQTNYRELAKP
jgi:chitin disaccharide deacetylase